MLALSEAGQIALIGAMITSMVAPTWLAWWNSRVAKRQMQPNGGSTMADKIDRIEAKVDTANAKVDYAKEVAAHNADKIIAIYAVLHDRQGKLDSISGQLTSHAVKLDEQSVALGEQASKLDGHIAYMNKVHDRSGLPERRDT